MSDAITMKEKLDQMISAMDPEVQGLVRFVIATERKYLGEKHARVREEIRGHIDKAVKAEMEGKQA